MRTQVDHPRFRVGQIVHHKRFEYRGVIVAVDREFQGTVDWYERVARSKPPLDRPWYRVLVDDAAHETYVAEGNLELDLTFEPIAHPLVKIYFDEMRDGLYVLTRLMN